MTAAKTIFRIIDRPSAIDPLAVAKDKELPKGKARGLLELQAVRFAYPSRLDTVVLNGLSMVLEAGKTTALVGGSGSGKSTVMRLLQRLYDPSEGAVLLDGRDVRTLSVRWLRQQIGLVSQVLSPAKRHRSRRRSWPSLCCARGSEAKTAHMLACAGARALRNDHPRQRRVRRRARCGYG